jgi:hypothetical protein
MHSTLGLSDAKDELKGGLLARGTSPLASKEWVGPEILNPGDGMICPMRKLPCCPGLPASPNDDPYPKESLKLEHLESLLI